MNKVTFKFYKKREKAMFNRVVYLCHCLRNSKNIQHGVKLLFIIIFLWFAELWSSESQHRRADSDSSIVEISKYNRKLRKEAKQARKELHKEQEAKKEFEMKQRGEHLDLNPILHGILLCKIQKLK